jgi:hypothetical protein
VSQLINTVSYVKRNIILIPFWIQEAMKRNKLELRECLDFKKIRTLLSLQDLAGFMALQEYAQTLLGMRDTHIGSLYFGWSQGINMNEHEHQDFLGQMVSPLSEDESIRKEVFARLFQESARQAQYEKPFICYDLSPEFEGVVIYPGFFTQIGDSSLQNDLVSAMLKALYVYEPYNEVCKTSLFKRHLELLSQK